MSQQKAKRSVTTESAEQTWTRLTETGKNFEILASVSRDTERNKIKLAVDTLYGQHTSGKRCIYKLFLYDVLDKCGPVGVLLCAVSLGTNKVHDMGKTRRAAFINKLALNKNKPPISSTVLSNIALRHHIPASIKDLRDQPPSLLKADDLPGFQISVLANQPPQSVFDMDIKQIIGFLQSYQSVSSTPAQYTNMLGLLQRYQLDCPSLQNIQLIIPWSGTLPSIDIKIDSKIGWSAKIQLSNMLAAELLKYVGFNDVGNGERLDILAK